MDIRFPGESQMIDRIIERFSQRYYECNESAFATQVGHHVLFDLPIPTKRARGCLS